MLLETQMSFGCEMALRICGASKLGSCSSVWVIYMIFKWHLWVFSGEKRNCLFRAFEVFVIIVYYCVSESYQEFPSVFSKSSFLWKYFFVKLIIFLCLLWACPPLSVSFWYQSKYIPIGFKEENNLISCNHDWYR